MMNQSSSSSSDDVMIASVTHHHQPHNHAPSHHYPHAKGECNVTISPPPCNVIPMSYAAAAASLGPSPLPSMPQYSADDNNAQHDASLSVTPTPTQTPSPTPSSPSSSSSSSASPSSSSSSSPASSSSASSSSASSSPSSSPSSSTHPPLSSNDDPFVFIKNLPPLSSAIRTCVTPVLPPRIVNTPRISLALDLDETLVHCSVEPLARFDFTFTVEFHGAEYTVYVALRPHLYTFLRAIRDHFEVIVFTASQMVYADKLLSILDADGVLIRHRVFRDSCVCVDGNYLKDLTVLGRDMATTVLVDNSVSAFGYHLDNGIPIESWFDDDRDEELLKLLPFLDHIRTMDDVRPTIRDTFKLAEFVRSL